MRSLSRAVARGRTIGAWARQNDVFPETAQQWSELPEFQEMLDMYRLRHAERLVGKIGRRAERAIDRLVELSELINKPSVSLGATKAIIEKWIVLTDHFIQAWKFQDLTMRVKALSEKRKGQSSVVGGQSSVGRTSTSPYPGPPIGAGERRAPVA